MLTIKEAAALVDGLSEYRVRQMCIEGELKHIKAGKKYLINQDVLFDYLGFEQLNFEDCEEQNDE
jgi:excisionase family DNA binding protein